MGFGGILSNPAVQLALGVGSGLAAGYAEERKERRKVQDERAKMDYQARLNQVAATQKQTLNEASPYYQAQVAAEQARKANYESQISDREERSSGAMSELEQRNQSLAEQIRALEAQQKEIEKQQKDKEKTAKEAQKAEAELQKARATFIALGGKLKDDPENVFLRASLEDHIKKNKWLRDDPLYGGEVAPLIGDDVAAQKYQQQQATRINEQVWQGPPAPEASALGASAPSAPRLATGGQTEVPSAHSAERERAIQMGMARGYTREQAAAMLDSAMAERSSVGTLRR